MADESATPNYHGQLEADTIDTITLASGPSVYEILATDASARIDYTTDGSDPVVGGSPTGRCIPPTYAVDIVYVPSDGSGVIKLISAGTPTYSIEAVAGPE